MISIIVPCYNSGLYLAKTLESVLHQTFADWECLIVNDGSTDNSEEVALHFCSIDKRFRVINKKNGGPGSSRNVGVHEARGLYIQFLDSDDILCKEKLSSNLRFLSDHPIVDIVYSGSRYFYTNSPDHLMIYGRNKLLGTVEITMYDTDVVRSVITRNPFVTTAPLYRKSVFDKVGYYDESSNYLEDWDFQIRCALKGMTFHYLGYHPDTAVLVRLHETSLMTNRSKVVEAKRKLVRKYGNRVIRIKPDNQSVFFLKVVNRMMNFFK